MVAPKGCSGVHKLPKAVHSCGFFSPCKIWPEIHNGDSADWIYPTWNRFSASKAANSGLRRHPLSGIMPMPRHFRSQDSKT